MTAPPTDPDSQATRPESPRQRELDCLIRDTIVARGVRDQRVLEAIRAVPRHAFVPAGAEHAAYDDCPLPIGWGQTISQPYIVALMSEAANPHAADRCLEIGTGSGYQTAILSVLCGDVFSIECIPELHQLGKHNLAQNGYLTSRVQLRHADGFYGWPDAAPFDLIVVTAAPPRIPLPLLEQLAHQGRLIVPVGGEHSVQSLERWTRRGDGIDPDDFLVETLLDVRFVPMVGSAQLR